MTDHPDRLWRFAVTADGGIADGTVFARMTGDMTFGFVDGMKVDARGNVFAVGPGGIWVIDPAGRHLGTIKAPRQRFTNLSFSPDGATLFLSAPEGLYRLPLRRPQ